MLVNVSERLSNSRQEDPKDTVFLDTIAALDYGILAAVLETNRQNVTNSRREILEVESDVIAARMAYLRKSKHWMVSGLQCILVRCEFCGSE